MKSFLKTTRWVVRYVLAAAFWLHALGALTLIGWLLHPSIGLGNVHLQIALFIAILYYSYIADGGIWSISVDLIYVYTAPLLLFGRFCWSLLKRLWKTLSKISPGLQEIAKQTSDTAVQEATKSKDETKQKPEKTSRFQRLLMPFTHLSILWCAVIIVSNVHWILYLSLLVTLFIAIKSIISLHSALSQASRLMEKVNSVLRTAVMKFTYDLLNSAPTSKEFQNSVTNVKVYSAIFQYLRSATAVKQVTRRFTFAIAIPVYVYTSVLCAFVYFDIAKIASINWSLSDALIDALFMPLAFTDLPHNHAIRLLGGLQVASLVLIGYDAIFKSISDSVEQLSSAATNMSSLMENPSVIKAVESFDAQKLAQPSDVSVGEPTPSQQILSSSNVGES